MKSVLLTTALATIVALTGGAPCLAHCGTCDKTIADVASEKAEFSKLVEALKAAEMVEALAGEGEFTVFAPTNEAFEALPPGEWAELLKVENKKKLQRIIKCHVLPRVVKAKDVALLEKAKTIAGAELPITAEGSNVKIDKAKIVKTDIVCSNGVIHAVDAVIIPKVKTIDATTATKPGG